MQAWNSLFLVPVHMSYVLVYLSFCTPRQRGLQGELLLNTYFYSFPAILIFLKQEAVFKIKIINQCKQKSATDTRKSFTFLPSFPKTNSNHIWLYLLYMQNRKKKKKKSLEKSTFTDSVEAVRTHKYWMSSLWLSLCFLLTKHNSSIILSLENMFCLPTQVHSLYSVYLQFVHTVWLC